MSFTYNDEGIRTSKTVNGVTTTYYLSGSQIVAEETNGNITVYLYDAQGLPLGMQYHASTYAAGQCDVFWFERNLLGDVVAVYDESGTKLVSYLYNAWGEIQGITYHNGASSSHTAAKNPFRYRGYYYDTDLGLYYLNSRYYDPIVCRFISADSSAILNVTPMCLSDKNLYAYCDNNPVMRKDVGGEFWHIFVGGIIGAVVSGVSQAITNLVKGKSITDGIWLAILSGATSGVLASTGVGLSGMIMGEAAISMAGNMVSQVIKNEGFDNFNIGSMIADGAMGAISGALGGPGKGSKYLTNLGKQTVKRIKNATSYGGFKAGVKEAGKAFAYYAKNIKHYYKYAFEKTILAIFSEVSTDLTTYFFTVKFQQALGR